MGDVEFLIHIASSWVFYAIHRIGLDIIGVQKWIIALIITSYFVIYLTSLLNPLSLASHKLTVNLSNNLLLVLQGHIGYFSKYWWCSESNSIYWSKLRWVLFHNLKLCFMFINGNLSSYLDAWQGGHPRDKAKKCNKRFFGCELCYCHC